MIHGISPIRAFDTRAKAGVYYVRTEAMVFGFDVRLEGEFDTDTPESEYVLVLDDTGKPLSTCRIHALPEEGIRKIIITSRDEAVGFYEKLGYRADYSKDCRALFPTAGKKENETPKKPDPRFVIVYMEKEIILPNGG